MWADRLELCRVLLKERVLELHRGSPIRLQGWDVSANLKTNRLIDEALDRYLSSRLETVEVQDLSQLPPMVFQGRYAQVVSQSELVNRGTHKSSARTPRSDRKFTQSPIVTHIKRSPSPRVGLPALTPHRPHIQRMQPNTLTRTPRMPQTTLRRRDLNRSEMA